MNFDPVARARSIPSLIKNNTLIDALPKDQLSKSLEHVTLSIDDALYILDKVQSKYNISDRFGVVRHIYTDFGEGSKFDFMKFIEFIRASARCLQFNILDYIASIVDSLFSNNHKISNGIKPKYLPSENMNIEMLKHIWNNERNFDTIYGMLERIAEEDDKDAMLFAVENKFVYMIEQGEGKFRNIINKAIKENNERLVDLLIESNIDINTTDKIGNTPLICASITNLEIVKKLLAVPGINVNAISPANGPALLGASNNGHHEIVKLLLTVPGIDVNAKNKNNWTSLIAASAKGHHEIVKLLLAVPGIDVNAKNEINWTALIAASTNNHPEIIKLLQDVPEIDVNAIEKDNRTALMTASIDGHYEVVKLLLTFPGIDVTARDKNNMTALILASAKRHHEIIKILLTIPGIDVNAKDKDNLTALMYASVIGDHEVVKLLLTVPGIDVNAKDKWNNTALIWASCKGQYEVVKLLLTVPGIDVNAKDKDGQTAKDYASAGNHQNIVELLLAVSVMEEYAIPVYNTDNGIHHPY